MAISPLVLKLRETSRQVLLERETKRRMTSACTEQEAMKRVEEETKKVMDKIEKEAPGLVEKGWQGMAVYNIEYRDCNNSVLTANNWKFTLDCLKPLPRKIYEHCVAMGLKVEIRDRMDGHGLPVGHSIWVSWA